MSITVPERDPISIQISNHLFHVLYGVRISNIVVESAYLQTLPIFAICNGLSQNRCLNEPISDLKDHVIQLAVNTQMGAAGMSLMKIYELLEKSALQMSWTQNTPL